MQVAPAAAAATFVHSPSGASRASEASPGLVLLSTTHPELHLGFDRKSATTRRLARMRRSVRCSGDWIALNCRGWRCWFVTLTYRPAVDWQPEHLSRFTVRLRKWCADRGAAPRYVWTAELTQRGVMHYHVAIWLPRALSLPMPDKQGWWPHGMTQRQLAIAPIGYLMKYVSKGSEDGPRFPKNARIHVSGGLCRDGRTVRAWLNLPDWVQRLYGVGEVARRSCGIVVRASGEVLASPWLREIRSDGIRLRLVQPLPDRFHGGPYCTWPPEAAGAPP